MATRMQTGIPTRFWIAAVVLLLIAAVVAIGGGVGPALIALVGGGVALAIGRLASPIDEPTSAPAPPPPRDPVLPEALDQIVAPILLVRHGRVEFANRAAIALFGGHILGEDVRIAIRHPAAADRLASGTTGVDDRPIELTGLGTPDQRWEMRTGDVSDGRRIIQLIDRTGSYAAERMRVDFVANASHELRTPLASILGFIETLGDEAGEVPAVRARFLKVMFDEARRMQRLVEDLISLSRIEAEKFRLPSDPVDLGELIEEICAELHAAGGQRGRDLVCKPAEGVPAVWGDRAQLSQVIHNLIGNAMKYGRAGTPIVIALDPTADNMVRLAVTDEGDGVAPEHVPRLTERFYRVDSGRSRSLGGTGLGLAIVKHIVERHRGRLDIGSKPGVGTTVAIILPAALSSRRNEGVTGPGS